jgi:Fe-S oxidoreductase
MAERKARAIENSQADLVVTCEAGCLLQMAAGLSQRGCACTAVHLAELLAGLVVSPRPAGP